MPLQKLPTVDLDNVNHRRGARERINQILDHSFDDSRRQTDAEKLAGITPVNAAYPPGDLRRYGADLTGATSSRQAFEQAIAANNYIIVPDGSYTLDQTVATDKSNVTIAAVNKGAAVITLESGAGSGAAAFEWTDFAANLDISGLKILLKNGGQNQRGFIFAELRSSRIRDNWIEGLATASEDTTAIELTGTGTFTGDVDIDSNYITNHLVGVDLQGSCTTVRIINNEMYTTSGVANSKAVLVRNTVTGAFISRNTIQDWTRGVYSEGTQITQVENYFENNTVNWEWVRGSGNARIWAQSYGDKLISGGAPVYPRNNTDNCVVMQVGYGFIDNGYFDAGTGYRERLRTFNLGDPQTVSFSAGNFTASGSMTWTVESGDVTTLTYSIVGTTLTVLFYIVSSVVGGTPSTELRIAIPGGFTANKRTLNPCRVLDNAIRSIGVAEVLASGTYISIYVDATATTNWTAGTVEVHGQLSFEVS